MQIACLAKWRKIYPIHGFDKLTMSGFLTGFVIIFVAGFVYLKTNS